MRNDELIGVEKPFRATKALGQLHIADKQGFDTWLNREVLDGEPCMVIVVPMRSDRFHAAAFRYYRNCVLPIVAEDMGEANLQAAHEVIAEMFLPALPVMTAKNVIRFKRMSTAMDAMPCAQFCDFIDRVIVWATADRGLIIPMADPAWKWKQQQKALAKTA